MTAQYHKIVVEKDTDSAKKFIHDFQLAHPDATFTNIQITKHCDGKQVTMDYDEPE